MTTKERKEYENLGSMRERAAWLLKKGVKATIDIDPKTLGLVARPTACGVFLPGQYDSESEAIEAGTRFLEERAA